MEIISYFGNIKMANKAVDKLKELGFKAYVDVNSHYEDDMNMKTDLLGTETAPSLSGLVLNSGEGPTIMDQKKSPLMAAMPDVSGMGGYEEIVKINCKVVVNAEEYNKHEIEEIVERFDGILYNPAVDLPEPPDDIDKHFY